MLRASDIKKALDPKIKRASQSAVNKIKTNIKKKAQLKNMTTKKDQEQKAPTGDFDDLRDIVKIRKQKAVINELGGLIHEQTQEKMAREGTNVQTQAIPTPMQTFLADNPEKIKDMSVEDVAKLSMMSNPSGSSNPMPMVMALVELIKGSNNGGGNNDLVAKILGMILEKMFQGNNGGNIQKEDSGMSKFMEYMMQQNIQNQNLLIKLIETKNSAPTANPNNEFMKEMFGVVKSQGDLENTFLKDKLREMEARIQPSDSLGEAKKVIDFMGGFKTFLGTTPQTPEALNHEVKIKEMDFEQARQLREEKTQTSRMEYIGDMIQNTVKSFGKALGEPVADAAKAKIEQFTEAIKNPDKKNTQREKISPELYRKEIDLGDLENLEEELAEVENAAKTDGSRSPRFRVYETGGPL